MATLDTIKVLKRLEFIIRLREQKKAVTPQLEVLVQDIRGGLYDAEVSVIDQKITADIRMVALETSRQFYTTRGGAQSPSTLTRGACDIAKFLTDGIG